MTSPLAAPLFSVIIPAYNYRETLPRAVQSVLQQQHLSCEVIIVNDGSTDDTLHCAEQLAQASPDKIRVLTQANAGPAAARNCGIRASHGQFLVFLDADDEMCDGALNKVQQLIERVPEVELIVGGHISRESHQADKQHSPGIIVGSAADKLRGYLIDKTIRISNGAVFFQRKIFDRIQFPEQFRNSEDLPVFACAIAEFHAMALDEPLCIVHKHVYSLRHNTLYADQIGMTIVDAVFDPAHLGAAAMSLRDRFYVRRALSLSRTYYNSEQYAQCLQYYRLAFQHAPGEVLRFKYLKRAIIAQCKLWLGAV